MTRIDDRRNESGNILFMILLAIVLIGALTVAIQSGNNAETSNIDDEALVIRASEIQRYASELERAVGYVLSNGHSEVDIRFAHGDAHADYGDLSADTDTTDQVFARDGGAAKYRTPPSSITTSAGQAWEFYGGTHMPQVGSARPDLIAVLPNVTQAFCDKINALNDQTTQPLDTGGSAASGNNAGDCVDLGSVGRFGNGEEFYDPAVNTPNTTDEASFTSKPAYQACVQCDSGANYFYHVLLTR